MFRCFFPSPRMFCISAGAWALAALLFWYLVARDWGDPTGLSGLLGVEEKTRLGLIYYDLHRTTQPLRGSGCWFRPHRLVDI